uniref:Uncharacterized protein n=1 Tax=Anguilla anguilla TaxID=7936 RepID=A0A0E9RSK3_ANGAN
MEFINSNTKNEVQNPLFPRVKLNCMGNAHVPYSMFGKGQNYTLKEFKKQSNKQKEKVARRKPFSGQQHSCKTSTCSRGPQQP